MSPIAERIAEVMAAGAEDVAARSGVRGLTEEDVRAGKTPECIERIWLQRQLSRKTNKAIFEQEEQEAEQHQFPLLPYSRLVYNLEQKHPGVYDFAFAFSYDAEKIDTARLNEAIRTAVANHPVFRGNEQYYQLEAIEARGDEAKGYLMIRLNRILGDGYSFGLLLEDICKAYQGLPLEPDYYFRYLQQVENRKQTREYAEHEQELRERYEAVDGRTIPVCPTLDKEIEEDDDWLAGEYILEVQSAKCKVQSGGMTMNERVCMATALAIMDYCGTDEAALTWAYLGRENEQERHIFGSLHRDVPLRVRKMENGKWKMENYCRHVKEEMQRGIRLSDYPWTLTDPQHEVWQYAVNVLQQPRLQDLNLHGLKLLLAKAPLALSEATWGKGTAQPGERGSYSLLDIEIEDTQLRFRYSATHYKRESIIRFAELIKKNIVYLASDTIGQ